MFIPVVLKDGREDLVNKDELQSLMVADLVLFFKRSEGWVSAEDQDTVRQEMRPYSGQDRREHGFFDQ